MTKFDKADIERWAEGQWSAIFNAVSLPAMRYGRNVPCPACGGTDRFYCWPDFERTGAARCRQCQRGGHHGIDVLISFTSMTFLETLEFIATCVGLPQFVEPSRSKQSTPIPIASTSIRWAQEADRYFDHAEANVCRHRLANQWAVNVDILKALLVGWDGVAYSIPERNAQGNIIGIAKRFRDGSKGFHRGGNRGLTFTTDWFEDDGKLFIVEGVSDTAAMMQSGYCCVGRPSNNGGLRLLVEFLQCCDRDVVVMGENDRKPDGTWPGRAAESLAERLMEQLQRPVSWGLPTAGKDARQQLQLEVA
jgi:phage/plasmid primase-like uncharacterized protein